MKNKYIISLISLALFATSCGDGDKKTVADNSSAVTVTISSASGGDSNSFLTTSGKIEAVNSANLSTRMMGYVDRIYVQVGEKVR